MLGVSPVSTYVVPVGVASLMNTEHAVPWQRSTRYPVTPTLSVAGNQPTLICVPLTAVAVKVPGADGGSESCICVVALATFE